MSVSAMRIMGSRFLQTVTHDDLFQGYDAVLRRGWVVVGDTVLLSSWHQSYYGRRADFAETVDYEVAVNGRGIPDLDLAEDREARTVQLLRRGVAFAWSALHVQHRQLPDVRMAGYVSAAPTLMEPDHFTGNVTFCAMHSGQPPYIDPARLADEIVVVLFTEDCRQPLPAGK